MSSLVSSSRDSSYNAPNVLHNIEELGLFVTHGYDLTEATGEMVLCTYKYEWDRLSNNERDQNKMRQGVRLVGLIELYVKDPGTMASMAAPKMSIPKY